MDSLNQPTVSQPEAGVLPASIEPPPVVVGTAEPTPPLAGAAASPAAAIVERNVTTSFGTDLIGSIQSLMGTIVIAIFVITFIVQAFQIPSASMEQTLLTGDYLLVNKLCYGGSGLGDQLMPYQKIARKDIIVFHYPVDPTQHFVKRVIGLPGDRLKMVNKKVFINGKALDEPYVRLEPANNPYRDDFPRLDIPDPNMKGDWWLQMRKLVEDTELIIPQGHYFVMGDNRDNSDDSRYWGFVPRENIIGRPLVIYWSVEEWDQAYQPDSMLARLRHLAYAVMHIGEITRWHRTLRLVH